MNHGTGSNVTSLLHNRSSIQNKSTTTLYDGNEGVHSAPCPRSRDSRPRSRDSRPRAAHRALTCAILGCPAILAPAIPSIGAPILALPSAPRIPSLSYAMDDLGRWRRSPSHPTGAASPTYPASARRPRRSARTTGTTTSPSLDAIRRSSPLLPLPPRGGRGGVPVPRARLPLPPSML
jgi:hypothetical protein